MSFGHVICTSQLPYDVCRTGQSPGKVCQAWQDWDRVWQDSVELKYIMEIFKCHVTLSNNSLYTDSLIPRIPQIFRLKEGKLNCIQ